MLIVSGGTRRWSETSRTREEAEAAAIQSCPVWDLCIVVCEDLEFSEFPCVGSVLWRVRTLSFQSSHLCELCAVVCEDFEFSNSHVCGPCAVACADSEFSKFPCAWVL